MSSDTNGAATDKSAAPPLLSDLLEVAGLSVGNLETAQEQIKSQAVREYLIEAFAALAAALIFFAFAFAAYWPLDLILVIAMLGCGIFYCERGFRRDRVRKTLDWQTCDLGSSLASVPNHRRAFVAAITAARTDVPGAHFGALCLYVPPRHGHNLTRIMVTVERGSEHYCIAAWWQHDGLPIALHHKLS